MDDEASQIQFFGISDDGEASAVRLDSTADSASQLKSEDEDTSMKTLPKGFACTSAAQCQLNGVCVSSRCRCDAAWTGLDCSAPSSTLAQAPTDAQCLAQIMALSAIYGKLNGDLWTNQKNWLDTTAQCGCDWWGVYCQGSMLGDMNVTNLQLSNNDASGFLPAMELIRLPRLERVALNGNQIGGAIPDEMGQLFSLQILDLSWNNLESFVPPKLGNLANLTQLLLYNNQLTGPLPATLGNLTKLERLYADRNHFSGGIPAAFGRLHSLLELSLFENNLTSVPKTLVHLRNLTTLALQSNAISGPLDPGPSQQNCVLVSAAPALNRIGSCMLALSRR